MNAMNLDILLNTIQYSTGVSEMQLAEWLDIDVATISRHLNKKSSWRKSKDFRAQWVSALNKCRECFGNKDDLCCEEICKALDFRFETDAEPYRQIFRQEGFAVFAEALVSDAWYEKVRESRISEIKKAEPAEKVSMEKQVAAIRAYSDMWTNIDRLFLKPQLLRIKPYFYEQRNQLPPKEDIDLGIALSLRIRDGIQYAQGLLPFIPSGLIESHFAFQQQIMSAKITKLALKCYQFEWETCSHPIPDKNTISVESIVAYSKYWTDIGEVFLEESNARLRKYFFEAKNELPENSEDLAAAKVIAGMYRKAMVYSELLLDTIPVEFRRSYLVFKENMMKARIIMVSMGF